MHLLPSLANKALPVAFSSHEIRKIYFAMTDTPGSANRTLMLVSKMFNYAKATGLIKGMDNPATSIEKRERYKEEKITRFLNNEEIKRLGEVLNDREAAALNSPKVSTVRYAY